MLLFFVIALAVAKTLPDLPVAFALLIGVGLFFSALYWFLFRSLTTGTAGRWLTEMALEELKTEQARSLDEVRFR